MIKPSTVVHFAGLPFGLGIAHCDIGQWHWGNSLREKSTCPQVPQGNGMNDSYCRRRFHPSPIQRRDRLLPGGKKRK